MLPTQSTDNNSNNNDDSNHEELEEETIQKFSLKKTKLFLKMIQGVCSCTLLLLALRIFLVQEMFFGSTLTGIIFAVSGLLGGIGLIIYIIYTK